MTRDQEIVGKVVSEWNCGAGVGIVVPTILGMLQRLGIAHGELLTVDGCCDALERMSRTALNLRDTLRKEQKRV